VEAIKHLLATSLMCAIHDTGAVKRK